MRGVVVKGLTTKVVENEKEALNLFFEVKSTESNCVSECFTINIFLLCSRER